ncbi:MAG TPA: NADH-quinone oxidoreductase subunit M [Gammaproteobacteria bacterium]
MALLSTLLLIPLAGIALIALLPSRLSRGLALLVALAALLQAWSLLLHFDTGSGAIQLLESYDWNPRLGSRFSLGVDGFSLPMVLLATLLTLVALLASSVISERQRGYYVLVLMLEAAMLGVFMARDWSLFYVFWELTLIPLFFLIDRWGGKNRHGAALNFVLYTMGGSVFMLVALLVTYDVLPGHTFDMSTIAQGAQLLSAPLQVLLFLGLLIGFGVKMPIFPLHGWLPLAHVEAPSPISILLSGVLLKMGSYGLIRAAEMLPDGVAALQGELATLALFSLIYGGLLAWRQTDLKGMIAYSSISHMGVVLLGIAALNVAGLTGAVLQMVAHGLVAGSLFLLIGLLYHRTHTRDIADYSSLIKTMPRFAIFTVLAFMAGIGMPGTAGFIAELHTIIGGFERWSWWVVLLSIGVLIGAAYSVRTVSRLFTGPVREEMSRYPDLHGAELVAATVLLAGVLLLGLLPQPALALVHSSVFQLSALFAGPP